MPASPIRTAVALLALALAPTALADGGPAPGAAQGGLGVLGGGLRYVTVGTGKTTDLEAVKVKGGEVTGWVTLRGGWGVPMVTFDGATGGLSRNRSTLVLAQVNPMTCSPGQCAWKTSKFAIFAPQTLRRRSTVVLQGQFSYDAVSPDGRTLYLIEHVSSTDLNRYLVRAYDLSHGRLLPGAIADRSQRGWVMVGSPMTRTTSAGGRFVYTLYQNPGGYPFVHALDTVRGVAHCIGLPWQGDQTAVGSLKLTLLDGGRTLAAATTPARAGSPAGTQSFAIDTNTYAVSLPALRAPHGFPWWTLGLLAIPLLAAGALRAGRRRAAPTWQAPAGSSNA